MRSGYRPVRPKKQLIIGSTASNSFILVFGERRTGAVCRKYVPECDSLRSEMIFTYSPLSLPVPSQIQVLQNPVAKKRVTGTCSRTHPVNPVCHFMNRSAILKCNIHAKLTIFLYQAKINPDFEIY